MKFYIAASTSMRSEVVKLQNKLITKGHTISYDWANLHKPLKPYLENVELAKQYAIEDAEGVFTCDVFILLMSEKPGIGSSTELGMAYTQLETTNKPQVYIVGNKDLLAGNLFYFHPKIQHVASISDLLSKF